MRGSEFLDRMSLADRAFIEEAERAKAKPKPVWIKWTALAACLCVVIIGGFAMLAQEKTPSGSSGMGDAGLAGNNPGAAAGGTQTGTGTPGGTPGGSTAPGGDEPDGGPGEHTPSPLGTKLYVGGNIYTWNGAEYSLPSHCRELGELTVTDSEPTEDCQYQADFEATGTVYVSGLMPNRVFVMMTIGGSSAKSCISFICTDYKAPEGSVDPADVYEIILSIDSPLNKYSYIYCATDESVWEVLTELPEGCEYIGTMYYLVPGFCDLSDNGEVYVDGEKMSEKGGAAAYAIPGEDAYIYVQKMLPGSLELFDAYVKCPKHITYPSGG